MITMFLVFSGFGEYAYIWGFLEYDAASLLFLLMVSLVVAHQPSFGGAWLVAGLMVVFGGLVGIGDGGASLPALTAGFFLVISYGDFLWPTLPSMNPMQNPTASKHCAECGAKNTGDATFCEECGAKFT